MAKNAEYKGNVKLIDGLTQANNGTFPLVEANAVLTGPEGERLDETLSKLNDNIKKVESSVTDNKVITEISDNVNNLLGDVKELKEKSDNGIIGKCTFRVSDEGDLIADYVVE